MTRRPFDGIPECVFMDLLKFCDSKMTFALVRVSSMVCDWTREGCRALSLHLRRTSCSSSNNNNNNNSMNHHYPYHSLLQCIRPFRNLQTLILSHSYCLDDSLGLQLSSLMTKLPQRLTELNLSGCHQVVTNNTIRHLSMHLTKLEHLDVSYCSRLTDEALANLSSLRDLKTLSLLCCARITDKGLASVLPLQRLTDFDLSYTLISDQGLHQVLCKLQSLVSLRLRGCSSITVDGIRSLTNNPVLQWVDVRFGRQAESLKHCSFTFVLLTCDTNVFPTTESRSHAASKRNPKTLRP